MFLKMTLRIKFFCLISIFVLIGLPISSLYACNSDDEVEEITKTLKKTKISHPLTLSRFTPNTSLLVDYTQQLSTKGIMLNLKRESTRSAIQYVWEASCADNKKLHLLAQGICKGVNSKCHFPLTANIGFPDIKKSSDKRIDWVSYNSNAKSDKTYYIKESVETYGGHAEPQLIADINALFTKDSDAVVELFTPLNKIDNIYICGLELFGPYDMCDAYHGKGKNRYNCVGQLIDFRTQHQSGQQTISGAIRNELRDRFKGDQEDAFVVIYHAHSPYDNVDSYRAESETCYHRLKFDFKGCSFFREKNNFDNAYSLSQLTSTDIKPDILYGYIHCMGDKKATYDSQLKLFSFP